MNKNVNWRFFFFFFPSFIFRILGIIIRTYYALRKRSWPLLPTLVLSRGVTEQHTAQPLLFVCVCAWSGREWRPLLLLRFYQTAISKSLFLSYFAKAPERDLRVGGKRRSQILPWVVYSLICTREKKKSRAEQRVMPKQSLLSQRLFVFVSLFSRFSLLSQFTFSCRKTGNNLNCVGLSSRVAVLAYTHTVADVYNPFSWLSFYSG